MYEAICHETGSKVAIKCFHKSCLSAKEAIYAGREVHLLGLLRGDPGVVQILGFFEDEENAYMVMVNVFKMHAIQSFECYVSFFLWSYLEFFSYKNTLKVAVPNEINDATDDVHSTRNCVVGGISITPSLPKVQDRSEKEILRPILQLHY